ncbi:hypothetical protein KSP40_PGU005003 [Platanthera guangdongensis]|uniref:Centromere protein C n=1 Tax=Platanthera guangdongensis TaxID=2320717 RepID=A0ABR2LKL9_9ASPA
MDQIEVLGRRDSQCRPGLLGPERKPVFNFSTKFATAESSQLETSDLLKRSKFPESNCAGDGESLPVINYKCLEHISDPMEYFSTYRILENAEKEINKLKGDYFQKLNKPHLRRDRQHRPGLRDLKRNKLVFKFPGVASTLLKTYSQLEGSKCTEFTNELERKLDGTEKSNEEKKNDELEKLMSTCRESGDREISNLVMDALQINPISVDALKLPASSMTTQCNFGLSKFACRLARTKVDGISTLKRRLSLMHRQDDQFLSPNSNNLNTDIGRHTVAYDKLMSGSKDFNNVIEELQSGKRDNQLTDYKKPRPNGNDLIDYGISKLEQKTLKTKLLDVGMMGRPVDHSSAAYHPLLSVDIDGRLAEISNLKRCILLENSPAGLQQASTSNESADSLISNNLEMHSLSPVEDINLIDGCSNSQSSSVPFLLSGRKLAFEDKMQSLTAETVKKDMHISSRSIPENPRSCHYSVFEGTFQGLVGALNRKKLLSDGTDVNLEEAGQASTPEDCGSSKSLVTRIGAEPVFGDTLQAEVNVVIPEMILEAEVANIDDVFQKETTLSDEQLETSCYLLEGKNPNGQQLEASGDLKNRKAGRKVPSRSRNKQNSSMRRKSLAGTGTVWKSGVRRSTRIRMKPLRDWCGERFLYGRVHDSLATVIGVKYETPAKDGGRAEMKVKSYVSHKYSNLVAQAALY